MEAAGVLGQLGIYWGERVGSVAKQNGDSVASIVKYEWLQNESERIRILTNCRAIIHTVFNVNRLPHKSKRSSRLGPSSSITSALYLPHGPK